LTCFRVFIASPGGLAEERKAFRDEIQAFNDADAIARGILFQPVGWEDTLGGIGRPQTLINEDVRRADYFVLLLWDRWGSPPETTASRFTSGTEEESHVAMECYTERKTMRRIVIMFKSVDPQQLSDAGPQLQKVLEFRKDIEQRKTHLFHSFDTTESFRRLIHKHLAAWLRDEENGGAMQNASLPPGVEPGIRENLADTREQELWEPSESSVIAKAWGLAEEGRLTEAEVEFARNVVGRHRPEPLIEYGRFLRRLGRLDQAAVMFEGAVTVAQDQRDQGTVARAYGDLGTVLQVRGDLEGAEQMYRKALTTAERLGSSQLITRVKSLLGSLHNPPSKPANDE
jgi:tetratricopeptide (TPR) repeat protein